LTLLFFWTLQNKNKILKNKIRIMTRIKPKLKFKKVNKRWKLKDSKTKDKK